MSWAENVRIESPEQIDFDLEVAGPGSRFLAQLIDWVFKWLVVVLLALVGFIFTALLTGRGVDNWSKTTRNIFLAALGVVAFLYFFGYDIYYEGYGNGQTPGKRRAGIRVVRDHGGPIDVTAACVRNLIGLADFLPAFYMLGGFVMLLNGRAQRLGDLAAGTIVIRERRDEAPDEVDPIIDELATEDYALLPEHLDRCQASDLHVLHSFFGRYYRLEGEKRRLLAENLCDIFLRKTNYEPAAPLEYRDQILGFLGALYRNLKARRQLG